MNSMKYNVADVEVCIEIKESVMPPSPYSLFLARNLPHLQGEETVDVGTGCGIQAIVAILKGAGKVYILDNNPHALKNAVQNAKMNKITGLIPLPPGDVLAPFPLTLKAEVIICNPASLPMRLADSDDSPYYAGPDGRRMIERLICQAEFRLQKNGWIYMVHSSIANLGATKQLLKALGFRYKIIATERLKFRSFYDRTWIDTLGGINSGLYELQDGNPVETLFLIAITRN